MMRRFLTVMAAVFCLALAGQAQPVYRFSVKVGIDAESVDSLGGLDRVKPMVEKMFSDINYAFNHTRRFKAVYDFHVDWDAFYVYRGISTEEVYKPHPDHDYLVVIDGYKSNPKEVGGGWYGSNVQTVYHARTHNDRFNNPFDRGAVDGIIHEFGHARGVPDIYAMIVNAEKNPVAPIACNTTRCIMDYPYGENYWSDYAVNMIDAAGGVRVEIDDIVAASCPKNIVISVKDASGNPVTDADVILYPVEWYSGAVTAEAFKQYKTSSDGRCVLPGDVYGPCEDYGLKYPNLFVDASRDGRHAYGWLPLYEVQNAYFDGKDAYQLDLVLKTGTPEDPFAWKDNISPRPAPEFVPAWQISPDGGIVWDVEDGSPAFSDHIEMSGERVSAVLRWGVESDGAFSLERSLVYPMLRTIPNDTHASLMYRWAVDIPSMVTVGGLPLKYQKVQRVSIKGALEVVSTYSVGKHNKGTGRGTQPVPAVKMTQTIYPSASKDVLVESYVLENVRNSDIVVYIPSFVSSACTPADKGVDGSYRLSATVLGSGTYILHPGEKLSFSADYSACRVSDETPLCDAAEEYQARMAFLDEVADRSLVLHTPVAAIDEMFRMCKIRASESIFKTSGGYMHAPGGESYYAAIWANDQAEYVNPFFPFLGYWKGNDSALNSYRHFARFMNDRFEPIPSSIIAEGKDIWNGAGDRGDAAMIAYGASRFALESGDKAIADELMPLIDWCIEYCNHMLSPDGVVMSDTDELEGRFPAGDANLCTSSLYYDALISAGYLTTDKSRKSIYAKRAKALRSAIEKHFGADMKGFQTYRYYEGNDLLRSWICIPLTCGIQDRSKGTLDALFSPYLWSRDGCLTQEGSTTYWDRSTLYALRGAFCAQDSDRALDKLNYYSEQRLLGSHVPYAIEAWPEGSQRHLSAESGLYCRVITEGLFGIRPTGLDSFTVTPSMPSDWDEMSLDNIHLFGKSISIKVSRLPGDKLSVTAQVDGKTSTYKINAGSSASVKTRK